MSLTVYKPLHQPALYLLAFQQLLPVPFERNDKYNTNYL